jgi:ERCC4-type nuclease
MKVLIDERENAIWEKIQEIPTFDTLTLTKQVLPLGDIILQQDDGHTVSIIERKTLSDLLASIKDGRYEEQSYRLRHTTECPINNIIYIIEGNIHSLSAKERRVVYSSMASLHFFKGFQTLRTNSVHETLETVLSMADKIDRNMKKNTPLFTASLSMPTREPGEPAVENYCSVVKKVKKDNITPENIGEIILCQIPGISTVTAIAVMKKFSNFTHFLDELKTNPACLDDVYCESKGGMRKMSKACIENLKKFFLSENTQKS